MQLIDISLIKTDNKYLRLDSNVDKLKKSIETVGIINPLILNENNELIAGGRRYTALKELGYTEVPCRLLNKNDQEQELISIDENLVRRDLTKVELEQALKRGRDLYEELYPEATKFSEEDLSTPAANEIQSEMPNEKRSFIDITAEKTGLSKKVIKSAIDREEKSSQTVKDLRTHGELNASQINEIIKLPKEEQEEIAELVKGKSAKEVRAIVKKVTQEGVENTIEEIQNKAELPSEYKSLKTLLQRSNKVLGKILLEEMMTESEELPEILELITSLRISLDQFLTLTASSERSTQTPGSQNSEINMTDEEYQRLANEAAESLQNPDTANL